MTIKEMFEPDKIKFVYQEILTRWLGIGLVIGMMICVGSSAALLLSRIHNNQTAGYLPWIAGFIAAEGILTQTRLRRATDLNLPTGTYLLVEWVVILISIKLFIYIYTGFSSIYSDFLLWQENFLGSFFEPKYLFSILVSFLVWVLSRFYAEDLKELEGDRVLLEIKDETVVSNRGEVRRRIINRFLTVGFGMIVLIAFSNLDFQFKRFGPEIFLGSRQGGSNLIVYFVLGLLLISLAHFAALRATWAWEHIPIDAQIGQRWAINSLLMLIFVGFIAILMPAHYSIGLFDTLSYVFFVIVSVIYAVFTLLILPLFMLLALVASLFHVNMSNMMSRIPTPPPPPPSSLNSSGTPAWLQVLESVMFWVLFFGVIGFAIIQFLRQNKDLLEELGKKRGWRLVLQAIIWMRDRIRGFGSTISTLVENSVQKITAWMRKEETGGGWDYINIRRLTPQQKIRFYFLALVRRSSELGLGRDPAETPYEYSNSLAKELTDEGEVLARLTNSFVEARYSRHPITTDQANMVRRIWDKLRKMLKGKRKRIKNNHTDQ